MPPKRKRPDRPLGEVGGRPSPHRPSESPLAQHDRDDGGGSRGGRGRGGRGGYGRRDFSYGQGYGQSYGQGYGHTYGQGYDQGYGQSYGQGSPHSYHYQQSQQNWQDQQFSQSQHNQPISSPRSASFSHQAPSPSASTPKAPIPSPSSTIAAKQVETPMPAAAATTASNSNSPPTAPKSASDPPTVPTSPPLAYHYENLTDDTIRSWSDGGRESIIQHSVQSRDDVDITELSCLFQEFIHSVARGRLSPYDAGTCVKEILGDEASDVVKDSYAFSPHTLLLDSLAIVMDNDPNLYRPEIRDFLVATGLSPALMREVLDAPLLQQLGLIRDTFARLGVRQATNLLYRQANYNLLREESEGYSKLITELFTTNSVPPPPPGQTFEKVKALIGTFDLDVGRVLDVTIDVAASILIKQYKFFVKFLRISSWWPSSLRSSGESTTYSGGLPMWALPNYPHWSVSDEDEQEIARLRLKRDVAFWDRARATHLAAFFELGGRQVAEQHSQSLQITNGNGGDDLAMGYEEKWIRETNTLPLPGNRVAAQLLGFKLRFYNSNLRDKADVLPANLLYLAALLIKINFISLADLFPHLSPPDDEMEWLRKVETEKLEREERESRGGQMNALLMAGVLPQGDDDNPTAASMIKRDPIKKSLAEQKTATGGEEEKKEKLPEPLEQKVSLLIQLLTIGAIPEALFILGRFPWIPEVFPEVLQRIHRILHVSLEKVYKESRPSALQVAVCPPRELPDADQTGVLRGNVKLSRPPAKKLWRWPFPDKYDTNESQNYRFYWDEWSDNIPICQTVDDVFTLCNTLLNLSGVNIGKDEALLAKLAAIGASSLAADKSDANRRRWHDLLRRLLLPALSHTRANASVVNAVWDLVRQYSLATRFAMYADWFEGPISRLPAMKTAFARSASETRATMKRVSLTNLSEMAMRLAKTSYASPGIVFKVAFEQLEVYSNLIEAFVECAKYFTDLSYDVLVWSLLNSLGKSRSRTQADHALTTSKWLQALSRFSGKVFRRYPVLDPTPVLKYVDNQLFDGNSTDLIILKEFVSSMGGIVDAADFTDYQVLSMAGGSWLRRHTLLRAQDRRFDNATSSKLLIQALVNSKLASRLLINLAQYRQAAIFRVPEDEAHIKYLSSMVDESHQTLIQYLDFLWSNLDHTSFDAIVPSIPKLMTVFGLDTSLAFLIGRASLAHRMFPWKETGTKRDVVQARKPPTDREGDVAMVDPKPPEEVINGPAPPEVLENDDAQKSDETSLSRTASAALQPIIDSVRAVVRPQIWRRLSPELFATFWALQLGDVCFPEDIYVKERQRIMSEWQAISSDRSDMTRKGLDRKAEKRKELMDLQGYLLDELSEHGLRKAKWKYFLTKLFQTAFPDPTATVDSVSDILLEQCFLPRTLIAPADAEYTYRFIKALHDWNAPVFRLRSLYDRLFNANRLRTLIFTCTVREAEYLGRFLNLILADLSRWHKNEPTPGEKEGKTFKDGARLGAYDKEGRGTSDQPRLGFALTLNEQGKPQSFVDHAQFRDLLFRWHKNLNMALKNCLGGSEWMQIRNAMTVLRAVLDHFPAVDFMATQFTAQLQKIAKREAAPKLAPESEEGDRVDLSVAAQGVMSELQKRKAKWVMVQAFRSNAAGGPQNETDKTAGSTLRPTAPDFRPQDSKSSTKAAPSAEDEDEGEVQDGKNGKGRPAATPKEPLPPKPSDPSREVSRQDEGPGGLRSSTLKLGTAGSKADSSRSHKLPDRPTHNLPTRVDASPASHITPLDRHGQARGLERWDSKDLREVRTLAKDGRDVSRSAWGQRETRESKEFRPDAKDSRELKFSDADRSVRSSDPVEVRPADGAGEDSNTDLPSRLGEQPPEKQGREARASGRIYDRPGDAATQSLGGASSVASETSVTASAERTEVVAPGESSGPEQSVRSSGPDSESRPRRQAVYESADKGGSPQPSSVFAGDRGDGLRGPQSRPLRDDGRDRGPRAPSPRRSNRHGPDGVPHASGGYGDRQGRIFAQDQRGPVRDPRDRSSMPSSNYRGERLTDRDLEQRGPLDKGRESSNFHRQGGRGPELDHRIPAHHDQNYGRLNPVASTGSDIPPGPRSRVRSSARGGHGSYLTGGPGRSEGRFGASDSTRALSPERLVPSGPSAGPSTGPSSGPPSGRERRGGYESYGAERRRTFGPGPETVSGANAAPPAGGVHPDRLAQMGGGGGGPISRTHSPGLQGSSSSAHGQSRYVKVDERQMTSSGGSREAATGSVISSSPLPSTQGGPPTGSTVSNDWTASGGGRRQLAGINNTLQRAQTTTPELSRHGGPVRGGGQTRQLLGNSDAQVLTGGSPVPTPSQERQGMTWHQSSNWGSSGGGEDGTHRRELRTDREQNRSDWNGHGRPSRRSSRERERERSPRMGGDGSDHGEFRARRPTTGSTGGHPDMGGRDREGRRPARELMGSLATGAGGAGMRGDLMAGRELRHRSDRTTAADEATTSGSPAGGYRSSRAGPPRDAGRDDGGGRKRLNEDEVGEREKRPRRS